ncbi:hypothetical protein SARC_00238 [Sphaeroforma arctica JP610]|uniref:Uncharacterized protein n=1 Tax=Sphaeroforma arctica JP610 TaxID=667725 RepID=A0A0L0GF92_9EUKA|nr:hypothetical protein SARC_00238 [Sphaeroforma arctica JP610]KNC87667.1 hypothetical protein SARC_00238 [Sphaeroforma arctica JP610]|eukprot:XP_014161569.1 hypothetical protein SARC_00238 [Sphaeroforma arctica JP610]
MFSFFSRKKKEEGFKSHVVSTGLAPVLEDEKHTLMTMYEGKMLIEKGKDWGFRPKYNRNILLMLIDEEMFLSLIRNVDSISTAIVAEEGLNQLAVDTDIPKESSKTKRFGKNKNEGSVYESDYHRALYKADRTDVRGAAEERLVKEVEEMLTTYSVLNPGLDLEIHHQFKSVSAAFRRDCNCPSREFHIVLGRKPVVPELTISDGAEVTIAIDDEVTDSHARRRRRPSLTSRYTQVSTMSRFTDGSRKEDKKNPIVSTGY